MKTHKITLLWSGIIGVVAIIAYSVFWYVDCWKNEWIKDISLAAFGSALLLVVTSIIGYRVGKEELRTKIVQESDSFSFADVLLEEGNQLSPKACARIMNIALNRLKNFYNIAIEYYQGCIFKDKNLQKLINDDIIPYAEQIANFKVKIAKPDQRIQAEFDKLWEAERDLRDKIDKWMQDKDFILGKEFNIDEDVKEQEKND